MFMAYMACEALQHYVLQDAPLMDAGLDSLSMVPLLVSCGDLGVGSGDCGPCLSFCVQDLMTEISDFRLTEIRAAFVLSPPFQDVFWLEL